MGLSCSAGKCTCVCVLHTVRSKALMCGPLPGPDVDQLTCACDRVESIAMVTPLYLADIYTHAHIFVFFLFIVSMYTSRIYAEEIQVKYLA